MLNYSMVQSLRQGDEYTQMTNQLKQLPKTIRNNLDSTPVSLKDIGYGEVEYYPSTGNNIGAMFYDHDEFSSGLSVNPHKVNFSKDRDELQIGGSLFNARIRRMVNDTIECYTLQTKRGQKSPLFIPYKDNAFLVLEPLA